MSLHVQAGGYVGGQSSFILILTPFAIFYSLTLGIVLAVSAGVFPAIRAARVDAIEVIRGIKKIPRKKLGAKGLIAGLQQVAGQNEKVANALFIADKALAIGEILINTQREISSYFSNPTWSLFPDGGATIKASYVAAAKIRAATSIASIVASSIAKFKGGGGASIGGGTTGGGSIAGAGATAPTIAPVTNTSTLVPQEPQQVFVTETDITNTQNQVAVIETQATIK